LKTETCIENDGKPYSPLRVLIPMGITLDGSLVNEELHLLIERGSDRRRRLPQQDIQWIGRG